jgi:hypothetical protein
MRTLIVFRSGGKGLARKARPPYSSNRCGNCNARIQDQLDWLCEKCRAGEPICRPIERHRAVHL